MTDIKPFGMIELAVVELVQALDPAVTDSLIGGDLSYDSTDDFYVWVGIVSGSTDETDGEWIVDIDVFDSTYGQAMQRCLDLEPLLLRTRGFAGSKMRIDRVRQNESPTERPWDDDDSAYRVGATYVFTARRTGVPAN